MFLKELIKFSSQHRTFYCYLIIWILSIWIFLLIAGMYKYIGFSDNSTNLLINGKLLHKNSIFDNHNDDGVNRNDDGGTEKQKYIKKYFQDCNAPNEINRLDEGGIIDGWKLQGILVLARHGDRGPMVHVRDINTVDCSLTDDSLLQKYRLFLTNSTASTQSGVGHSSWIKSGPFHGFPLLPPSNKICFLGQLTPRGISQFLHIGEILRQAYGYTLGISNRNHVNFKATAQNNVHNLSNHIDQNYFNTDEIVIYSTRYRRTFQSAMALLYTLLPIEKWLSLLIQESHSSSFCFADCACAQAEALKKVLAKASSLLLSQHPAVSAVGQWIGTALLQNPSGQIHPLEVREALLLLICHTAPLPCHKLFNVDKNPETTPIISTTDPNDNPDVINIDQDDNQNSNIQTKEPAEEPNNSPSDSEPEGCVEHNHVYALMSYTHWLGIKEMESKYYHQTGLLRAYGLIRNLVSYMLKMISGDKIKFVLYSGHDRTMQYILSALGLNFDNPFIPYAARLIFEVYKSDKATQYYFRLLYNGHDVTRQVDFCEGGKSLRIPRGNRGKSKADLCPIENIIRFIHDDYFTILNATNFKDACTIQKENEL